MTEKPVTAVNKVFFMMLELKSFASAKIYIFFLTTQHFIKKINPVAS